MIAREELVEEESALRARLEQAVNRVCPGWLADRRDDLVQEAHIRIMQVQRRTEEGRPPSSSYLYRTAHSVLVDEIRRRRRLSEVQLDEGEGRSEIPGATPSPERRYAALEIGRGIQSCLARMVRPRRLAVTLYLQGHRVREAAQILDWSPKRTENLVFRGLADLRKCLDGKGLKP